ncbi:MAG: metallophosphoesterase [Eubacterium sp.]|nr:metallophosphoesterase [Eubacterium sp.]
MRILAIADLESKYYWDFFEKSKLEGLDLIISAGDLDPHYLSFLATYAKCPVLYVHGNHDYKYESVPPDGCICIEDTIYEHEGVKILGLGGSMRYNMGADVMHQYDEKEMASRVRKLKFKMWRKGVDILVTHSPAYNLNDGDDLPHTGFKCFYKILDTYNPGLFIHGHVHRTYGRQFVQEYSYKDTRVINAFERCIIDFEPNRKGDTDNVQ